MYVCVCLCVCVCVCTYAQRESEREKERERERGGQFQKLEREISSLSLVLPSSMHTHIPCMRARMLTTRSYKQYFNICVLICVFDVSLYVSLMCLHICSYTHAYNNNLQTTCARRYAVFGREHSIKGTGSRSSVPRLSLPLSASRTVCVCLCPCLPHPLCVSVSAPVYFPYCVCLSLPLSASPNVCV